MPSRNPRPGSGLAAYLFTVVLGVIGALFLAHFAACEKGAPLCALTWVEGDE